MNGEPPELTELRQRVAARHRFRARAGLAAIALFWVAGMAVIQLAF